MSLTGFWFTGGAIFCGASGRVPGVGTGESGGRSSLAFGSLPSSGGSFFGGCFGTEGAFQVFFPDFVLAALRLFFFLLSFCRPSETPTACCFAASCPVRGGGGGGAGAGEGEDEEEGEGDGEGEAEDEGEDEGEGEDEDEGESE